MLPSCFDMIGCCNYCNSIFMVPQTLSWEDCSLSPMRLSVGLISNKRKFDHMRLLCWGTNSTGFPSISGSISRLRLRLFVHNALPVWGLIYLSCTCNPVQEVGARAHLRSAIRGELTVPQTKTRRFGPRSLCLRTGCLELTARGHSNSGTITGTFQIYVENTFISPSIC